MTKQSKISLGHWGAFEAEIRDGRFLRAVPLAGSCADPEMIASWPALVHSAARIDRPHVRRGFLDRGPDACGNGRGREEMMPVTWETALNLAAGELRRIYRDFGPTAVFGGSYGWSSAGRFHHARTQVRRFLGAAGGFVDQVGNYSWGAAYALLPHVLGSTDTVSGAATSWDTIAESSDAVVAFGGLNAKNWHVTSGGAGNHHIPDHIARAAKRGVEFVVISPFAGDVPPGVKARLIQPRPNSDTAILLALAYEALFSGRADLDFLASYTKGQEAFCAYLRGETDGVPKTLDWAAGLSGVTVSELRWLWHKIARGRIMLTAAWSLQRADNGEQPFWALIALAAMLGQIGLPGGGFGFGYGSLNAVGEGARKGYVPSMPTPSNAAGLTIPAAALPDCLLRPGESMEFNGRKLIFPDVRLVYWAGGNPFHHAQDLGRLEQAWQRPEVVIVNEPWWTPTAQRADIVFPATTSAERNDIGGSSRDPHVFAMPRLVPPQGEARDDFAIFCALAERLGCRATFDEGLDEAGSLDRLWERTRAKGRAEGIDVPTLVELFEAGFWSVPSPDRPEVLFEAFRTDPESTPLQTPSGRIELFSETVAGFGYTDAPGHPTWIEPHEWLGRAERDELHLLTPQPAKRLHSQLWQTRPHDGPEEVRLTARDATQRGVSEGMLVRLHNGRGACLARARIDDGLRERVIVMPTGAWFAPHPDGTERNGNPNVLTAHRLSSRLGQACTAQSTLVRLSPWTEESRRENGAAQPGG